MRIAVYSGSFNPLHIGHLAILKCLCDSGFDKVLLVVSPQNPLRSDVTAESSRERYDAACKALARHPELSGVCEADDIELSMPAPTYTIRTLDALRRKYPDDEITLVMGADNLEGIRRWKDYRRILLEYGIAVYPRKGADPEALSSALKKEADYKIELLDAPSVDMSSTLIRGKLAAGEDVSELLM